MNILEVTNLSKTYGSGNTAVQALKNVSFTVPKGEFVAIVGESGFGKSTLLNILGALDVPTSGSVMVNGQNILNMNDEAQTIFRRRNIGFIFQAFNLVPELTVEQNIIFPVLLDYQKPDFGYLEELLRVLNIQDRRNHLPGQLSGGQQQRAAIGRALFTRPSLILADEPTGNLDSGNAKEVIMLLKETSVQYEQTVIMITHSRTLAQSADRFREERAMSSYLSFVPISAKQHRRQNRMTVTCIEIAVFLVTAVFSMADMAVRQETVRLVAKHGSEETAGFFASEAFRSLFPIAGILFLFVLAASVFMIAGTLNSNVAGRTRQFGLMRCIGMSRRQIIRCVRLEALNWCRTAVPVGAGAGTAVTWILCAVLKFAVGGEWADMSQLKISWIGVVSGMIVGVLTVWIAAGEPARKAAKVAPVAAVSGETRRPKKARAIPFSGRLPVEKALGIAHAVQKKKNLVLMTGSFALSILLFLSFSVFIDLVNCLMPQSAGAADIEIYAGENGFIEENLLETLKQSEGVERAYGRRAVFDVTAESGIPDFPPAADLISFEDFDLEALKKDGMLEKNSRLEDVKAAGGALIIADTDIAVNAVVTLSGTPLKIACRLKYNPFSTDGSSGGKATLIVSDETFREITGIADYTMLLIRLDGHASEENVSAIRAAAGDRYEWNDCRENDTHGTYLAFLFCVYGFLAIIAMVTVLNIMNSIAMSVSDRMKQYGIMRSVGMSKKSAASMIAAEALTFALIGCAAGIAAGLPFGKCLYDTLVTSHFAYARWQFPAGQLLIIAAFFLVSVLAGIRTPIRRLNEMSITQTISQL